MDWDQYCSGNLGYLKKKIIVDFDLESLYETKFYPILSLGEVVGTPIWSFVGFYKSG